jgi:hypothetical protein
MFITAEAQPDLKLAEARKLELVLKLTGKEKCLERVSFVSDAVPVRF